MCHGLSSSAVLRAAATPEGRPLTLRLLWDASPHGGRFLRTCPREGRREPDQSRCWAGFVGPSVVLVSACVVGCSRVASWACTSQRSISGITSFALLVWVIAQIWSLSRNGRTSRCQVVDFSRLITALDQFPDLPGYSAWAPAQRAVARVRGSSLLALAPRKIYFEKSCFASPATGLEIRGTAHCTG